ncbi:MAG TPA: SDR family oxidoreductase [Candidatus Angelobacter sp.]|nr:SDR family oxidoreductase [Candidatus Angelobacter sp.]
MILITGASGHVGRRLAELLAQRGAKLRLMGRDTSKLPRLPNAEQISADYNDIASLDRAMAGIERAFIVSGHSEPGQRAREHRNAIQAAARAGVKHLVYTSFQGASPDSKFPYSRDHYQTEQYLAESGVPFTALRDSMYMDMFAEMPDENGVIRGPAGNGVAAFVSREDVAQVAAAILSSSNPLTGTPDVTGPEAITFTEAARRLSAITGRNLRFEDESLEEGRRWRRATGAKDWQVETWVGSYAAIAAGEMAQVSDTVARLTGHPPLKLEDYFSQHSELLKKLKAA